MLAAVFLLQAAGAVFSPPIGTPMLVTTEHRSAIGGEERRYTLRRLIRFERTPSGYRAEVRISRPEADAPAPIGGMIEAGFATLAGNTLVFTLDRDGKVVAIDQMDALWERLCSGIAAMVADGKASDPAGRAALTQRIAAPLRALPDERRLAMLSTLVTAVIADEPVEPAGTITPVQVPGASPLGAKLTLRGVRTTSAAERGELQAVTRASGTAADAAGARVEIERTQRFDPRTGLVSFSNETRRVVSGPGGTERSTVIQLAPATSEQWEKN